MIFTWGNAGSSPLVEIPFLVILLAACASPSEEGQLVSVSVDKAKMGFAHGR